MTNIWIFSGPSVQAPGQTPSARPDQSWFDQAFGVVLELTTDGKWIGLLTIMFGIGLEIQRQSAIRRGESWPGRYPWRALLLILDGLLNYIFIFQFDVLMGYGLTALVVCVVMAGSPRTQKIWMVAGVLLHLAHLAFIQFAGPFRDSSDITVKVGQIMERTADNPGVARGQAAQLGPEYLSEFDRLAKLADLMGGTDANGTGSYWAMVVDRTTGFIGGRGEIPIMLTMGLGLYLVGAHLYRAGLFRPAGDRLRKRVMIFGFGVGIPVDTFCRLVIDGQAGVFTRYFTSTLVAFGVLAAIAAFYAHGRTPGRLGRPFELVGRMALTCYLLQNLICSAIFYDWGLGLANRLAHLNTFLVTLPVYVLVAGMLIGLSWAWLRRFDRGPVEWLWHASYDAIGRGLDRRKPEPVVA